MVKLTNRNSSPLWQMRHSYHSFSLARHFLRCVYYYYSLYDLSCISHTTLLFCWPPFAAWWYLVQSNSLVFRGFPRIFLISGHIELISRDIELSHLVLIVAICTRPPLNWLSCPVFPSPHKENKWRPQPRNAVYGMMEIFLPWQAADCA